MMVYICEKRTGLYTLYRSTFLLFLFMYILNFPPLFCHDAKLNFGAHAFAFSVLSPVEDCEETCTLDRVKCIYATRAF